MIGSTENLSVSRVCVESIWTPLSFHCHRCWCYWKNQSPNRKLVIKLF